MKYFTCKCQNTLFFDNSQCVACAREVGYDYETEEMVEITPGGKWQRCANGFNYQVCNWVVPAGNGPSLCPSCRLNRVIPSLSLAINQTRWAKIEAAKRRALYSLIKTLILIPSRKESQRGLVFDFLSPQPNQPVLTGHDFGIITLNIEEADDAIRELNRENLGEPYRTLLGHFRHEIAHYFWWLWFDDPKLNVELHQVFREVFGDESVDYDAAIRVHYNQGAPIGWETSFITAYATMHPWEDWAETWAHYFLIIDAVETAQSFGLDNPRTCPLKVRDLEWTIPDLPDPYGNNQYDAFISLIHQWSRMSPGLNEVSQSFGQRPLYPFVLSAKVMEKLYFVHCVCHHLPTATLSR